MAYCIIGCILPRVLLSFGLIYIIYFPGGDLSSTVASMVIVELSYISDATQTTRLPPVWVCLKKLFPNGDYHQVLEVIWESRTET